MKNLIYVVVNVFACQRKKEKIEKILNRFVTVQNMIRLYVYTNVYVAVVVLAKKGA